MIGNFKEAFSSAMEAGKKYEPIDQEKLKTTNRYWSEDYFHEKKKLPGPNYAWVLCATHVDINVYNTETVGIYTDWDLMMLSIDRYLSLHPNPHINWDVGFIKLNWENPGYDLETLSKIKEDSKAFYKGIGWRKL